MIKREIELTMRMDHPSICRVYNVVEDEEKIYMIIDDLRGKSLFHHIVSKNVMSEPEAATITA